MVEGDNIWGIDVLEVKNWLRLILLIAGLMLMASGIALSVALERWGKIYGVLQWFVGVVLLFMTLIRWD